MVWVLAHALVTLGICVGAAPIHSELYQRITYHKTYIDFINDMVPVVDRYPFQQYYQKYICTLRKKSAARQTNVRADVYRLGKQAVLIQHSQWIAELEPHETTRPVKSFYVRLGILEKYYQHRADMSISLWGRAQAACRDLKNKFLSLFA